MEQAIYAHEILEMLRTSKNKMTKIQLKEIICKKYGEDARFTTCCGELYTADQAIEFFIDKEKVFIQDNMLIPLEKNICRR